MEGSMGMGCMAVFAVSGSVALLALSFHKRLLSDFMEKIEFEVGSGKSHHKKRVRFTEAEATGEPLPSEEKQLRQYNLPKACSQRYEGLEGAMPQNRLALYRGIIKYRMHFPKKGYGVSQARVSRM